MVNTLTPTYVKEQLKAVKDPEIPFLSVVAMGIVRDVRVSDGAVEVDIVPTFAGCPAIQLIRQEIVQACLAMGASSATVNVLQKEWSTNEITQEGIQSLKDFGITPPEKFEGEVTQQMLEKAICPQCNSEDTFLMSSFGPTACRAIYHCRSCKETFEKMKPL